jgi:Spy/CpxP family protein refolding chaperone
MNRYTGKAWVAVAGLAIVLAVAHVAEAQRGEGGRGRGFGRGGFGALTTARLATAEEVQKALNLTAEQKDKVAQINDDFRDKQRELFQQGGDQREVREEAQKLSQETDAKLAEALDATQNKRLIGILAQVDVDGALSNATVAKDLGVTNEQKESLAEVRRGNRDAMMAAMQDSQDLSREERTAKMNEIRAEAGKKLLAALTTDQQAKYEALKGEPVKIDMSQIRGFGGRGGGGGRGDRGNRDRDRQGAAAESDRGA